MRKPARKVNSQVDERMMQREDGTRFADEDAGANLQSPQASDPREEAFRRFKISDAMLTKYGYTEGCDQCMRKERGSFIHGRHSESCRMRIQNLLMDDETRRGVLEHQQERKKQNVERSQQVPSTQLRTEDDAAVAQRARENPQQPIESAGTPSPGTPLEICA